MDDFKLSKDRDHFHLCFILLFYGKGRSKWEFGLKIRYEYGMQVLNQKCPYWVNNCPRWPKKYPQPTKKWHFINFVPSKQGETAHNETLNHNCPQTGLSYHIKHNYTTNKGSTWQFLPKKYKIFIQKCPTAIILFKGLVSWYMKLHHN